MNKRTQWLIGLIMVVLVILTAACGAPAPEPTPTSPPPPISTDTAMPPTSTPKPTATPQPTRTPNLAATAQYESWQAEIQHLVDDGYLDTAVGKFTPYHPFSEEWAQINWYQWEQYAKVQPDFMLGAHFKWSTASATPEESGCGFIFGIQKNGDHYAVFLDKSRILFMMGRGENVYEVGKTSGPGKVSFGNPAEADFQVLVKGQKAHVFVDGQVTTYTLSEDQSPGGGFGLSVLSGTNKDYGTRCEATDIHLWWPED